MDKTPPCLRHDDLRWLSGCDLPRQAAEVMGWAAVRAADGAHGHEGRSRGACSEGPRARVPRSHARAVGPGSVSGAAHARQRRFWDPRACNAAGMSASTCCRWWIYRLTRVFRMHKVIFRSAAFLCRRGDPGSLGGAFDPVQIQLFLSGGCRESSPKIGSLHSAPSLPCQCPVSPSRRCLTQAIRHQPVVPDIVHVQFPANRSVQGEDGHLVSFLNSGS